MEEYKESDPNELEGFFDWKGRAARKDRHGGTRSAMFVYAMEAFDNTCFIGIVMNLVTYLTGFMHMQIADSATTTTNFLGTAFMLTLLGGFVSDSYINRFKTILLSSCIQLSGVIILLIQAHYASLKPPPCNPLDPTSVCTKVSGGKAGMLFIGLYLVAIGNGGVKAALPSFGADQFDERDPKERRQLSTYFNMFFLSLTIGASIASTVVVWVETNKGLNAGFGLCTGASFLSIICILAGIKTYRNTIPGGSPLTRIMQVFVAALHNRKLSAPENSDHFYQVHADKEADIHTEKLLHTNQFKFLDKAAILTEISLQSESKVKPNLWRLCPMTQVEEIKVLVRMVPIFLSTVLVYTCLAQLQTFTVSQGVTMDRSMGKHFKIPAASLPVIGSVFLFFFAPVYEKLFVPFARRFTGHETGITHLQRIGIGLFFSAMSMGVAALVEVKRKNVARDNRMLDVIPLVMPPLPISVFWLALQYFVFGIADMFAFVGLMEFFYSEAPIGMRSLGIAFSWASLSIGYFLSSVLVNIVSTATKHITKSHGWLGGNNLNRNHLDLFYWLLAILSMLNFLNFLVWSRWYKKKPICRGQIIDEPSIIQLT